jgi:hypothetical protein
MVVTVTGKLPALATSVVRIVAVTWLAITTVVDLAAPLKFTTAPEAKLVPLTVSVNCAAPALIDGGLSELIVGAGGVTVKDWEAEVPPAVVTVTG